MQRPFLFPVVSAMHLEPNQPLNLGVLKKCGGERPAAGWVSVVVALLIPDHPGPRPHAWTSLGSLFCAFSVLVPTGQHSSNTAWLVQRETRR